MMNRCISMMLLLFVIFSGCSKPVKQKVIVYSPHGKEMLSEFEKKFEELNPEIDVQWLDMGSQEVFDRIRTERENPQADLWWGAPSTMFMKAEKMDLLEKYRPSWADEVYGDHKSDDEYWYGTFITPEVIAYNNKNLSKETAPQDWDDLVSPEWKDKIILRNPVASGTLRAIFCAMIAESVKRTGSTEEGFEWLRKLDENTSTYAADPTQMYIKLSGDETAITLWNMPDIILQATEYNYPFGYVFPAGGTVVLTDGIAIVKGSRNREAAEKFYEFVTSIENLLVQTEKFYRIPARNDIPRDKLPEWIAKADFKEMNIDWLLISENESDWMKRWDSEIKGRK
jgi:iron(III) transport system substrate-binding protein